MPNVASNTGDHKDEEVASTTLLFAKHKAGSSNPLSPCRGNYAPRLVYMLSVTKTKKSYWWIRSSGSCPKVCKTMLLLLVLSDSTYIGDIWVILVNHGKQWISFRPLQSTPLLHVWSWLLAIQAGMLLQDYSLNPTDGPTLLSLHQLPISYWIQFQIAPPKYRALHGPAYPSE